MGRSFIDLVSNFRAPGYPALRPVSTRKIGDRRVAVKARPHPCECWRHGKVSWPKVHTLGFRKWQPESLQGDFQYVVRQVRAEVERGARGSDSVPT